MTGAGNGPEGRPAAAADRRALTDQGKLVYREKKRWGFLGLPFTFTTYLIYENDIQIKTGFLSVIENDCYMYKISDVEITASLLQRMAGLSTIVLYTSDVTDRTIVMKNIKHGREIKDFILQASEAARIKRRTMNMQNISPYSAPGCS